MKYHFLLLLVLSCLSISAQDAVFSQFYNERTLLNPALTGLDEGMSFSMQFREQWYGNPQNRFQTAAACIECRTEKTGRGLGFFFSHDREGAGALTTINMGGSLAQTVSLGKNSALHLGLSGGYAEKFIDFDALIFSDQISAFSTQIDPGLINLPATAAEMPNKARYGILSGGLAYRSELKLYKKGGINRNPFFSIGASIQNTNLLIRSEESLLGENSVLLPLKYAIHGGLTIPIPKDWAGSKVRYWNWTLLSRVWSQNKLTAYSVGVNSMINDWGVTFMAARGRRVFSSNNANAYVLGVSREWTASKGKQVYKIEGSYDIPSGQVGTQMGGVLEISLRMRWMKYCPFGKRKSNKPTKYGNKKNVECPKMNKGSVLRIH